MDKPKIPSNWFERHVLDTLDRIEAKVDCVDSKLTAHEIENAAKIARLEEKTSMRATVLGAISGAATGLLGWFIPR